MEIEQHADYRNSGRKPGNINYTTVIYNTEE